MAPRPTVLYFASADQPASELVSTWASGRGFRFDCLADPSDVRMAAMRSLPALIVVAGAAGEQGRALCRLLKGDPFTGIIPVAIMATRHQADDVDAWFAAGADEVLTPTFEAAEQRARLGVLLERMRTSIAVHPSTRLPGTTEIERNIRERLDANAQFAVCYADLDHFKEFNDRYSYYDGDRVISVLARLLRDVVKGLCGDGGFVGHIGGDDFLFVIDVGAVPEVCTEILSIFDTLIPFQYSDQDRRAGYFFGKDRRGQLYKVPLMTLSIGIVTNERRTFAHPAQVSGLATEMKSYAKTLPGSVFVVDRRQDPNQEDAP